MNCPNCGAAVSDEGRFCPHCGHALGDKDKPEIRMGESSSSAGVGKGGIPPASAYAPFPVPGAPSAGQETPAVPAPSADGRKKKRKKPKKQSSGCLMSFLISVAVFLGLGLILFYVIGRILPTSKGNSKDRQVQPEYTEPAETSELRRELGGNYSPDEKDFRFDGSRSVSGYVDHIVLVYFRKGVSDDEVRRTASLVDGELVGCISGLDIFEIRVPASGSDALREICERLEEEENVDWATLDEVTLSDSQWSDPGLSEIVPNDPWGEWTWIPQGFRNTFLQQWSMVWPRGDNWHQEIVGAPSAWAYEEYYSPISVGIIDGGFDTSHPDLRITIANPAANNRTLDDSELKDSYDHGTRVAGIIGATRGNGTGGNGILCGEYTLYGYCVKNQGSGKETDSEVLASYESLLSAGCRVINRSRGFKWRYEDDDGKWHDCINENNRPFDEDNGEEISDEDWKSYGVDAAKRVLRLLDRYGKTFLMINSSGNEGIDARYNGWICSITRACAEEAVMESWPDCRYTAQDILDAIAVVGAVDRNNEYGRVTFIRDGNLVVPADIERSLTAIDFSNFGPQVTILAPGKEIYSTVDHRSWMSDYNKKSGTSYSAPIVAACAAQVWSIDLSMSPGEVKECLVSTAVRGVRAGSVHDDTGLTYSMVNLKDAVESVLLRKGYISGPRPDGDLKKIAQTIAASRFTAGQKEIERLLDRYMDELNEGRYAAAISTMTEMITKAYEYQVYGFFYIFAELL